MPRRRDFSSPSGAVLGSDLSRDRLLARRAVRSLCSETVRVDGSVLVVVAFDLSFDLLRRRCRTSRCSGVALVVDARLVMDEAGATEVVVVAGADSVVDNASGGLCFSLDSPSCWPFLGCS